MTKLERVAKRLAEFEQSQKSEVVETTTVKTVKTETVTTTTTEYVVYRTKQFGVCYIKPDEVEKADLYFKGCDKLKSKFVNQERSHGGWIDLNYHDNEDLPADVFTKLYGLTEEEKGSTPLYEKVAEWFDGLETLEQRTEGRKEFRQKLYKTMQFKASSTDFNQDYGLNGIAAKDELSEVEVETIVQKVLENKPILMEIFELEQQGYQNQEIAEMLGIHRNTVRNLRKELVKRFEAVTTVDSRGRRHF